MNHGGHLTRHTPLKATRGLDRGDSNAKPIRRRRPASIRSLRWDEEIPEGAPRRYRSGEGYIRLRWKVGTEQYVEEYEHRIVAGRPNPQYHVHHKNEVKDDNRPENLEVLTAEEHEARHGNLTKTRPPGVHKYAPYKSKHAMEKAQRRLAREAERRAEVEQMREFYESGLTTVEVAGIVGIDESNVYRRLVAAGVKMRGRAGYAAVLDVHEIGEKYAAGRSKASLAREYRVDAERIMEAVDAAGVPRRKPGRPKNHGAMSENRARRIVYERSGGLCEVRIVGLCTVRATDWQHRKNRSQGGQWRPENGLHACRQCHAYIHQHPIEAVENGWTVESHESEREREVLLARPDGGRDWYLLDNAGKAHLAPWPEHPDIHPDDLEVPKPVDAAGEAA